MGKVLPCLTEKEIEFIASQKVFFVATAPLSRDHHVSVSPKSNLVVDVEEQQEDNNNDAIEEQQQQQTKPQPQQQRRSTLVVLDGHTMAYADLTGSGAETAAHILQNGRLTIMVCNIESGEPRILRCMGQAQVILAEHVSPSLRDKFPTCVTNSPGFRAVYMLHVTRISSSCGYSMPIMQFVKFRTTLDDYTDKQGHDGMHDYCTLKNSYSIDGLPSLALLRTNAPKNIQPVHEDGYIYGKVVGQSDVANEQSTTIGLLHQQQRRFWVVCHDWVKWLVVVFRSAVSPSRHVHVSVRDIILSILIAFAVGICLGHYLSSSTSRNTIHNIIMDNNQEL